MSRQDDRWDGDNPKNTLAAACGNCTHSWEDCDTGIRKRGKCDLCDCKVWGEPEYRFNGDPVNS